MFLPQLVTGLQQQYNMACNNNSITQIPEFYRNLITGFIRLAIDIDINLIPMMLAYIIMKYYYIAEYFHYPNVISNKHLLISNKGKEIELIVNTDTWYTVFGSEKIVMFSSFTYIWTYNLTILHNIGRTFRCWMFGLLGQPTNVANYQSIIANKLFCGHRDYKEEYFYALSTCGSKYKKFNNKYYGEVDEIQSFSKGTIKVELNTQTRKMKIYLDGIKITSFNDIKTHNLHGKKIQYNMAMSVAQYGTKITLQKFEIHKIK